MKKFVQLTLVATTLIALLSACSNDKAPTSNSNTGSESLGILEITINGIGNDTISSTSTFTPNPTLTSQALSNISIPSVNFKPITVETFVAGGTRYINANFGLNNPTATAYQNITAVALDHADTDGTSPFKEIKTYGGTIVPDATSITGSFNLHAGDTYVYDYPTQTAKASNATGYVDNLDTSSLTTDTAAGYSFLNYGFRARSKDLTSFNIPADDGDVNTFEGQVTFSSSFTTQGAASDPFSYTMVYEVAGEAGTAPVQALFEEDFDTFTGAGFAPTPAAGQLDSDLWAVEGLSDGSGTFGGTHNSGDFARGTATSSVITGGIYAFEVAAGNYALGVQPGTSDMTPGSITLKYTNNTGTTLSTGVKMTLDVYTKNDQGVATLWKFQASSDNVTYQDLTGATFTSPEAATGSTSTWIGPQLVTVIITTPVPDAADLYIRAFTDDASGSGSRDEFAFDNIKIERNN